MTDRPPRKVSNLVSYFQNLSSPADKEPSRPSRVLSSFSHVPRSTTPASAPATGGDLIAARIRKMSLQDSPPRRQSEPPPREPPRTGHVDPSPTDVTPAASPTCATTSTPTAKLPLRKSSFIPKRVAPPPPFDTVALSTAAPTPAILVPATVHSVQGQSTKVQVVSGKVRREEAVAPAQTVESLSTNDNLEEIMRPFTPPFVGPLTSTPPTLPPPPRPPSPVATFSSSSLTLIDDPLRTPPLPSQKQTHFDPPSTPSRPPLTPKDSSPQSYTTSKSNATSNRTITIPAASIFKSNSDPLHLPELDSYLDELPKYKFTNVEEKGFMSDMERKNWESWNGSHGGVESEGSWEDTLKSAFTFSWAKCGRRKSDLQDSYIDLEKSQSQPLTTSTSTPTSTPTPSNAHSEIFLPMNLVPPHLTVSDLQAKRGQAPLLTVSQIMGVVADGFLGAEGSDIGIGVETVESFRDMIQIITLLLTSSPNSISLTSWFHTVFVAIPSTISLDFVSAFGMAILWYWVFTLIAAVAMYEFIRFTGGWRANLSHSPQNDQGEGFDKETDTTATRTWRRYFLGWRDSRGYKMLITFVLSTLYLPLSKIAIGALVWTSDFWAIPNPYLTTDNPTFLPLGPSSTYYEPLDFCYKTTMLKPVDVFKHFNWAWIILPVAAATVGWFTIWFPWRIHLVIRRTAPTVDKFTQLGVKRKDMQGEYRRLLEYDRGAFNFLYRAYREEYQSFKAIYMGIKLVRINVLLVCVLTKDNCLLRSHSTVSLSIIREGSLTAFLSLFLIADLISKPYLDYTSNSSDIVSRVGYVVMALIGLLVALNVKGKEALSGPILIMSNVTVYSLNAYFALIGTNVSQRIVKRLQKRLDFSIDLFSPHLNFSKHISTRIWQETVSVILFASPEFKFVKDKERLCFSEQDQIAPFLLDFDGSQAERHSENLQILRHIGYQAYAQAARHDQLDDTSQIVQLQRWIERYYTGPDIFWEPSSESTPQNVVSHFGRLDVLPFPFTCIFRYDEVPASILRLTSLEDLQRLVYLNEQPATRERRQVRLALRALDGQSVLAPHIKTKTMSGRGHVKIESHLSFRDGILSIARNSDVAWRGYNFASGFRVSIHYSDGRGQDASGKILEKQTLVLSAEEIDIPSDFTLSPSMARLFQRNRKLIDVRLPIVEGALERHRAYFAGEAAKKRSAMSYSLLLNAVLLPRPISAQELSLSLSNTETALQLRNMPSAHSAALSYASERFEAVTRSRVSQFWYLYFDDLWRRNAYVVSDLAKRPSIFSPHYKSSICYQPMSRAKLETILRGAHLLVGKGGYFNAGILNKLYFYLDEVVFQGTQAVIPLHIGHTATSVPFDNLDAAVPARARRAFDAETLLEHSYTLSEGTGDGTDYDDDVIRTRRAFTFEEIFDRPQPRWSDGKVAWFKSLFLVQARDGIVRWLGLKPLRHAYPPSDEDGITVELRHGLEGWEVPRNFSKTDKVPFEV